MTERQAEDAVAEILRDLRGRYSIGMAIDRLSGDELGQMRRKWKQILLSTSPKVT